MYSENIPPRHGFPFGNHKNNEWTISDLSLLLLAQYTKYLFNDCNIILKNIRNTQIINLITNKEI